MISWNKLDYLVNHPGNADANIKCDSFEQVLYVAIQLCTKTGTSALEPIVKSSMLLRKSLSWPNSRLYTS